MSERDASTALLKYGRHLDDCRNRHDWPVEWRPIDDAPRNGWQFEARDAAGCEFVVSWAPYEGWRLAATREPVTPTEWRPSPCTCGFADVLSAQAPPVESWQPIETAPSGESVLVYGAPTPKQMGEWYVATNFDGAWEQPNGAWPDVQPTHWMPLPAAPSYPAGPEPNTTEPKP